LALAAIDAYNQSFDCYQLAHLLSMPPSAANVSLAYRASVMKAQLTLRPGECYNSSAVFIYNLPEYRPMSFFDSIKKMSKDASTKISNEVSKFKNKDFLNAVVAGCALVASADGSISSAEKQKMLGFINSSDELKVFSADEVIAAFNNITSKFDFDFEIGKAEALKVISKIKSDVAASKLMIRVCCIIGASDGDFDTSEKAVVSLICRELGISEAEFDLK
jgi:tellurite resistance protein TerB